MVVSIHTLTRRVTHVYCVYNPFCGVSIHTLTRRVTFLSRPYYWNISCFNPHPHAEGDTSEQIRAEFFNVSIHTLTRRVTVLLGYGNL